ncbi:hypothetical protein [Spiroplasma endosymbiont of Lariophagus distinguendus]|uniref:hypothetical protein n=1 Tax=Spiroplasma endosymbiont of Lariophagus distinguendus TaxID=2935082 RepID=UPI00207AF6C3|nr:hypothetical protein [Spiroplasma endosymbiont of Lariophagus distinguendus]
MNKEKIIEYYTEIIKDANKEAEHLQKKIDELIVSVLCYHRMVEKIKNGEFDE